MKVTCPKSPGKSGRPTYRCFACTHWGARHLDSVDASHPFTEFHSRGEEARNRYKRENSLRWVPGTASLRGRRLRVKGYRCQPLKGYSRNVLGRGKRIRRCSEAGQAEDRPGTCTAGQSDRRKGVGHGSRALGHRSITQTLRIWTHSNREACGHSVQSIYKCVHLHVTEIKGSRKSIYPTTYAVLLFSILF